MRRVFTGDYEVIDSGSIIAFDYESGVTIDYSDTIGIRIDVIFEDKEDSDLNIGVMIRKGKIFTFRVTNLNSTIGAGMTTPFKLGNYNGRYYYFVLWAKTLGNKQGRKLDFTVYGEMMDE